MYEFKMKINVKSIQSFACFVVFFKLMPARKSEIEIHPNRSINMDIGKICGIKNEHFKQMLEFNEPKMRKNGKTQHEIQEISH